MLPLAGFQTPWGPIDIRNKNQPSWIASKQQGVRFDPRLYPRNVVSPTGYCPRPRAFAATKAKVLNTQNPSFETVTAVVIINRIEVSLGTMLKSKFRQF